MMNIIERMKAPTPRFFQKLGAIGIGIATAGSVILAAPVSLPEVAISAGGYLIVIGSVIATICQTAVDNKFKP